MDQSPVSGDILTNEQQLPLPNATAVLVLGILSIVVCFVCGIIALSMSSADIRRYKEAPHMYTVSSYEMLKAGRICSIIGVCISCLIIIFFILFFIFAISIASFTN